MRRNQISLIQWVASYADAYKAELVARWRPEQLVSDGPEGLRFFFGRVFYGGGRDDRLSSQYVEAAERALAPHLRYPDFRTLGSLDLGSFSELEHALVRDGLTNGDDRQMVRNSLEFTRQQRAYNRNIVRYSLTRIREGQVADHYRELTERKRAGHIHKIGDDKVSFYLRDLAFLFDLGEWLDLPEMLPLQQPVTGPVKKISKQLGILTTQKDVTHQRWAIIRACQAASVHSNDYNAGAWWVGTHNIPIGPDGWAA
jgi:hypothetical protein